jgi:hypothetical protein
VPLAIGVPPFRVAVDERAGADLEEVVRLPVLELAGAEVLLPEVVLTPVGFLVVAIYFVIFLNVLLPSRHRSLPLFRPNNL